MIEPQPTQYDLHFALFGFPIRVNPWFWLFALLGGLSTEIAAYLLIWACVLFVSILAHELGHAFMMRRFGRRAHVVLYALGGLAIEGDDDPYRVEYSRRNRTPQEQILISFAGPAVQFLLAGAVAVAVYAGGGTLEPGLEKNIVPFFQPKLPGNNVNLMFLVHAMLYFNVFWAAVNLLPVYPLDGGQIAQQVFMQQDPWGGMVKALWLSVWTGGIVAAIGAFVLRDMFIMLLFGSLAYSNYHAIQQMGGGRSW
jgi:Zn-dependent protease